MNSARRAQRFLYPPEPRPSHIDSKFATHLEEHEQQQKKLQPKAGLILFSSTFRAHMPATE